MTIGEQLKAIEDQQTRDRVARRSDMLRKFVKDDLLKALNDNIKKGGNGHAPVQAPSEIGHLFAQPLSAGVSHDPRAYTSTYGPVWKELDEWAASENLSITTGSSFDNGQRGGVPWDQRPWGGYLTIKVRSPEPLQKPTPPPPTKVMQGAEFSIASLLIGTGLGLAISFLLFVLIIG